MIHETLFVSGIGHEIIVVGDDSPDRTAQEASGMADRFPVVVCRRVGERGLATALLKGFGMSQGEICLVKDADMSHPVSMIPRMLEPTLSGAADATVGTRYVEGGGPEGWPWFRRVVSRVVGLMVRGVTSFRTPRVDIWPYGRVCW